MKGVKFKIVEVYEDGLEDMTYYRLFYKSGILGRWKEQPIEGMPQPIRNGVTRKPEDEKDYIHAMNLIQKKMGELSMKGYRGNL